MSSDFSQTISRNLVRVSGLGYRENIELHAFRERTQPGGMLVNGRAGGTGPRFCLPVLAIVPKTASGPQYRPR